MQTGTVDPVGGPRPAARVHGEDARLAPPRPTVESGRAPADDARVVKSRAENQSFH
jgi:hypothetical protein